MNLFAIERLQGIGYPVENLGSKSWDEFARSNAPALMKPYLQPRRSRIIANSIRSAWQAVDAGVLKRDMMRLVSNLELVVFLRRPSIEVLVT